MPLYEYECDACGHRFETIQKFSDPPIETCPSCGRKVHKLQSAPAIQFKGTGWYVTDYAKSGNAETKASKDSRKADKDAATKADGKTDGQAAGKAERKEGAAAKSDASSSSEKTPSSPSSPSSSSSSTGSTGSTSGTTSTGSTGSTGATSSTSSTSSTGTKTGS